MFSTEYLRLLFAACLAFIVHAPAMAGDYPTRPIKLIVPFVAGGAFDVIARLAAEKLLAELGQPVVVDYKPGAGGTFGGRMTAMSKPDGYTFLLTGTGSVSIAPALYGNLGYSPSKDLVPVIQLTTSPFVLTTSPAFKGNTVKELLQLLKSAPGHYNYASTGNGTLVHLAGEYFKNLTHTEVLHVPYLGGSQATMALLSNDVLFSITNIPNVQGQLAAGKLKGLAMTSAKRSQAFPDIPTMVEAGVPGFELSGWIGIFAPKGTPDAIVEKINAAFATVMKNPDITQRVQAQGDDITTGSVAQFKAYVADSDAKWAKIVRDTHIAIE